MAYYIGFKIETPKIRKSKSIYMACTIIKVLKSLGYINTKELRGNLHRDALYIVAIKPDIYKCISKIYSNNKLFMDKYPIDSKHSIECIPLVKCLVNPPINEVYDEILLLNINNTLNKYKLLL